MKKETMRPLAHAELCKGCDRCLEACARGCIEAGTSVDPQSGFRPVHLELERCSGCGLCIEACPEPFGLVDGEGARWEDRPGGPLRAGIPDLVLRLGGDAGSVLLTKGTHAAAIGALLAGCRHFFGYPITPSTEGAELMAAVLPRLGGCFFQAVSEIAAVNLLYGCGGAGRPGLTFTSSPGFSLMLEGLSYLIGAEVPAVIVDVMRGGPGLGNIGPEQSDIKLACRGLGHGHTHAIVLAPATPQEMLDFTRDAFALAFRYRNPVIVTADGSLGQMSGRVELPRTMVEPGLPAWAVSGDRAHRGNLISSIRLAEADLEAHNEWLSAKYEAMAVEARADVYRGEDAELLFVAAHTPARTAKGAVDELRRQGVRAGLFRPQTLWPFPVEALRPLLRTASRIVVVEASAGQLEDELRLALSKAELSAPRLEHVRRMGGVLPSRAEVLAAARGSAAGAVA